MNILSTLEQTLARNESSNDKDKSRLKSQRETIIRQEREIKLLKQQIRKLEKDLNKPSKEDVPVSLALVIVAPKKLTPAEIKEATRQKFAEWNKKNSKDKE